jgi:hypothetical protein
MCDHSNKEVQAPVVLGNTLLVVTICLDCGIVVSQETEDIETGE